MTGAPATVRDDARCALHDRLPVGSRVVGDQDLAGLEVIDLGGAGDDMRHARADARADGMAGEDNGTAPLEREFLQDGSAAVGGDGQGQVGRASCRERV